MCPLCHGAGSGIFHRDARRDYLQCPHCGLVFVPSGFLLPPHEEKAQYDLHQNHVDDPGYRNFLARVATPLMARVPAPAHGLDFGCGPGPALAAILQENGYRMAVYDPFYHPDVGVLAARYRFITCTEVIEHVHDAAATWAQLFSLLEPGGWLGIMTKRAGSPEAFAGWHYKTDPTHVRFYSEQTLHWIARKFHARLELAGADVALFRKPPDND